MYLSKYLSNTKEKIKQTLTRLFSSLNELYLTEVCRNIYYLCILWTFTIICQVLCHTRSVSALLNNTVFSSIPFLVWFQVEAEESFVLDLES
jgi:hypothetical protein